MKRIILSLVLLAILAIPAARSSGNGVVILGSSVDPNTNTRVLVTVQNQGSETASFVVSVTAQLSNGTIVTEQSVPMSLDPGAGIAGWINFSFPILGTITDDVYPF